MLLVVVVIGGLFEGGCTATKDWVREHVDVMVEQVEKKAGVVAEGLVSKLQDLAMKKIEEYKAKLAEKVEGYAAKYGVDLTKAKDAMSGLIDTKLAAAEAKRKAEHDKQMDQVKTLLAGLQYDATVDTNKDGKVDWTDFDLDKDGDLSPVELTRLVMYYDKAVPLPGQQKDNTKLYTAAGILTLLWGAGQVANKKNSGGGTVAAVPKAPGTP
jgi:hypothetical protein